MTADPGGWRRYFTPLNLAAYVTWAAISLEVWLRAGRLPPVGGAPARAVAMALLGVFLLAMLACTAQATARDGAPRRLALALMAASALGLVAVAGSGTAPVLLIILASMLTFTFPGRRAALMIVVANLVFAYLLIAVWQEDRWWLFVVIYGGFQAFAAFTSLAVLRADAAATELRDVNARLLATRSLLAESARDGERLRVSRELHDVSGHKLTALKLNLAALLRDPALAGRRELQVAGEMTEELLADIRSVVSQLRQHDGIDLREALQQIAAPFPRPQVHLDVASDARVAGAGQAEALVRVAQEGLTNIARHARADNAWLSLGRGSGGLELVIEDDGPLGGQLPVPGHGLLGMRERLESLGGRLATGPSARGGFRLVASLPPEPAA